MYVYSVPTNEATFRNARWRRTVTLPQGQCNIHPNNSFNYEKNHEKSNECTCRIYHRIYICIIHDVTHILKSCGVGVNMYIRATIAGMSKKPILPNYDIFKLLILWAQICTSRCMLFYKCIIIVMSEKRPSWQIMLFSLHIHYDIIVFYKSRNMGDFVKCHVLSRWYIYTHPYITYYYLMFMLMLLFLKNVIICQDGIFTHHCK